MYCPSQVLDEIDNNYENITSDIYWMRKDIRTMNVIDEEHKTQAGNVLDKVLKELNNEEYDNIEISFDLAAIKSEDAPGRSDIVTAEGITADEAKEMSYIAGKSPNVKSFIITEFNPGIETRKTGALLMEMFHSLILGANDRQEIVNSE